jgi:hypothetical protein
MADILRDPFKLVLAGDDGELTISRSGTSGALVYIDDIGDDIRNAAFYLDLSAVAAVRDFLAKLLLDADTIESLDDLSGLA